MKFPNRQAAMAVVCLVFAVAAKGQEVSRTSATAQVPASEARQAASETIIPRLVKFNGTLLDAQERPMAGPVGVTFALYSQQSGGAALWMETQNVKPDGNGNYVVLLGANSANGLPTELFVSGEARWLGIQVGQQPEHERILLVSVPYALKAGDAETLGGLPASAFVTTGTPANAANSAGGGTTASSASSTALPGLQTQSTPKKAQSTPQAATPCSSVTSDGAATANSIALFTTACNIESSVIKQSGANVGIGTAAPAVALDVLGNNVGLRLSGTGTHQVTVTGTTSGRLGQDSNGFFFASDTNGKTVRFLTNNGTLNEWMRITSVGNVGIGTTTPAATLNVVGPLNLPVGLFTGNTSATQSFILAATQSGSTTTTFNGTPSTAPPTALAGVSTATTNNAVGVVGVGNSAMAAGVAGVNFSLTDGSGLFAFAAGSGKSSAIDAFNAGTSGFTRGIHAEVSSTAGVAGLFDNSANSGAGGDLMIGRTGISGAHVDQFRVDGGGDVLVLGNFHSATAGNGIILKSPDGTKCTKLGIDNTGLTITLTPVTCPAVP